MKASIKRSKGMRNRARRLLQKRHKCICSSVTSKTGIGVGYAANRVPFCRGSQYGLTIGGVGARSSSCLGFASLCLANVALEGTEKMISNRPGTGLL
jgi:hypothetical protein